MAVVPRIAIRADASTRIGTGHVRRMRSLASAMRASGAEVRFFCRALDVDCGRLVGDHAIALLDTPAAGFAPAAGSPPYAAWAGIDQIDDAAEFSAAAAGFAPDWVVVDHYAFDARWHDAVRDALSCRIVAIDDVADRPLSADILVDHNLHEDHARKYAGLLRRDCAVLAGPRHALIDPVFADARRYRHREPVERIGLFFGGADPEDMTSATFAALRDGGFRGEIGVVAASVNPHVASLRALVAGDGRATLGVDLPDLAGFFADHDIQIGAGGGATWERLCIGAPSILVALAENQHQVLAPLASHGVAVVLPPAWRVADICDAVRELTEAGAARRLMSERAQAMVDGLGTRRVADTLLQSLGGAA